MTEQEKQDRNEAYRSGVDEIIRMCDFLRSDDRFDRLTIGIMQSAGIKEMRGRYQPCNDGHDTLIRRNEQ